MESRSKRQHVGRQKYQKHGYELLRRTLVSDWLLGSVLGYGCYDNGWGLFFTVGG